MALSTTRRLTDFKISARGRVSKEATAHYPFSVVSAAMNKPLDEAILKSDSLPGVLGDCMLTKGCLALLARVISCA
jgi:hypothetical protein